jgi:uncharacterized cysteine cluster protein YcgN (CxxCxxCC family)
MTGSVNRPFWESTPLAEMTAEQWESLCDGCARCCLEKLEDAAAGSLYFTRVACQLLDLEQCRCTDYHRRAWLVPDCLRLTPDLGEAFRWLPVTCAYRLLHEGRPLHHWHPLVSGTSQTVHREGISVRGLAVAKSEVTERSLADLIILSQDL